MEAGGRMFEVGGKRLEAGGKFEVGVLCLSFHLTLMGERSDE
jgi:hypothetical protein